MSLKKNVYVYVSPSRRRRPQASRLLKNVQTFKICLWALEDGFREDEGYIAQPSCINISLVFSLSLSCSIYGRPME